MYLLEEEEEEEEEWNNHTILLHLFYIDGDNKRYLKELIPKKYFKIIFFHILFIVMFI